MKKKYIVQSSPFIVPPINGKLIEEYFGMATDQNSLVSIACMIVPPNWSEPFQTAEFDEYSHIIRRKKQCTIDDEKVILKADESIKIKKHTKVQYANPFDEECEYLAICIPAFTLETVHQEN